MGLRLRLQWYDKETELGEGNEFSLDFLFLVVECSSEQRISPRPISAILERVSCLTGVKIPILQALQAQAD